MSYAIVLLFVFWSMSFWWSLCCMSCSFLLFLRENSLIFKFLDFQVDVVRCRHFTGNSCFMWLSFFDIIVVFPIKRSLLFYCRFSFLMVFVDFPFHVVFPNFSNKESIFRIPIGISK